MMESDKGIHSFMHVGLKKGPRVNAKDKEDVMMIGCMIDESPLPLLMRM